MTGSAGDGPGTPGRLATLLAEAATDAARAASGRAAGVYLCSRTPGLLRLATLAGLPGELFQPWWRVHTDRPFPIADAHRLGVAVVLPNATEAMRRYPQFAAGLPFPFGSLSVPVATPLRSFGVLTVLRPSAQDVTEIVADREGLTRVAHDLAKALVGLERGEPVVWDEPPLCVHAPPVDPQTGRVGCFGWEPETDHLTADLRARSMLGLPRTGEPGTLDTLVSAVAPEDAERLSVVLHEAAHGIPPIVPVPVHTADGALRLLDVWNPRTTGSGHGPLHVSGAVLEPVSPAHAAAELLPEGVFCVDRLGVVVYANPRAALLLGVARDRLLGRSLWETVPWLGSPGNEDHLRGALLAPEPVHFHTRRPTRDEDGPPGPARGSQPRDAEDAVRPAGTVRPPEPAAGPGPEAAAGAPPPASGQRAASPDTGAGPHPPPYEGDWLALSLYPGEDLLTCTVAPAGRVSDTPVADAAAPPGPDPESLPYRPIVLAIALNEAVTARQVSAVVMQELLPAFGGRRLAIYLLQDRHLYLAWETGFPDGFLSPFEGVGLDARLPGVETLTTGRPLFFDSMQQLQAAYPGIPLDATEGARAFLPLIASGRPVGSCILGFDRPRSFSTEERTVLTALAGLIAHAMEKAQRYDTEAALARGLQRALLPQRLATHPQVEAAGRYLPGTEGMDVGGDWYDVVEAGDGLALVIGDVQGHGVQAAATMGQLRSAVRAFALGDRPPEEVISGTNHLLIDLDPGQFASCCYVRLDPATGRARVVRAGHPPPLLRHADGRTEVVDLPGGVVLGVDARAHYPVAELELEAGAVLALYTDGLVERPGTDIDDGITALRHALAGSDGPPDTPLADLADKLTATARQAVDRPDDIALLLAARHCV
ncbi:MULTISPECIES: SpoIIE family protein phosphatase [unclassified Streptomyces]|uniref:SpoIIE family protein phosphatase n=1 Tax=unclassified Streptomyces TaxID=2593676 RepID=UPI001F047712|nr:MULTISPECIES: SpoIIE family protein phosphatase [unclassified Streptomyces]MCH0566554.1 SpoIIE family protein phosphatase [Streptomyces sp. MUM 2J]MCH0571834.1 SpoIIE family protein phosphatase [Streptomyces sp. MUM 136J]